MYYSILLFAQHKNTHLPTIESIRSFLYFVMSPDYTLVTSSGFQKCSIPRKDNHSFLFKKETSDNADEVAWDDYIWREKGKKDIS